MGVSHGRSVRMSKRGELAKEAATAHVMAPCCAWLAFARGWSGGSGIALLTSLGSTTMCECTLYPSPRNPHPVPLTPRLSPRTCPSHPVPCALRPTVSHWWVDWVKRLGEDICNDLQGHSQQLPVNVRDTVQIQIGQVGKGLRGPLKRQAWRPKVSAV